MRLSILLALAAPIAVSGAQAEDNPSSSEAPPSALERFERAVHDHVRDAVSNRSPGMMLVRVRSAFPSRAEGASRVVDRVHRAVDSALEEAGFGYAIERTAEGRADDDLRAALVRGFDGVMVWVLGREGGMLVARAEVAFAEMRGWSSLFRRAAPEVRRAEMRFPLDAELRGHIGGPPRISRRNATAISMMLPSRGYLAIGELPRRAGDPALALVHPEGFDTMRLRREDAELKSIEVRSGTFATVPRSASGSRRPVATATSDGERWIVRTSEHASAIAIRLEDTGPEITPISSYCPPNGFPQDDGCARRTPGRDVFESVLDGTPGAPPPPPASAPFYARRVRHVRQATGELVRYEVTVSAAGRLAVRTPKGRSAAAGYGAALALADVDADGLPEVLASSADPVGQGDRLTVLRIRPDGSLVIVWSSERLAGSVLVAGSADVDGDGLEELLAIEEPANGDTNARLWVVR